VSTENRSATIIEIDGLHVAVEVKTNGSGDKFIALSGVDCNLEGEMPGEYYVTPLVKSAEIVGANGATAINLADNIVVCERCGSDDLGHFDAHDLGDDSVTGVSCEKCGWEFVDPTNSPAA
jgi:hypothetical protein